MDNAIKEFEDAVGSINDIDKKYAQDCEELEQKHKQDFQKCKERIEQAKMRIGQLSAEEFDKKSEELIKQIEYHKKEIQKYSTLGMLIETARGSYCVHEYEEYNGVNRCRKCHRGLIIAP